MNNFKEIAKLVKERRKNINALYDFLKTEEKDEFLTRLLKLSYLENNKASLLAILRRLVDLKEENLVKELEKMKFKEDKITRIKHIFYDEVRKFYEREHQNLIDEIERRGLLSNFYQKLIQGVHNIGLIINKIEVLWTKELIEKNNKILASHFPNLEDALMFLQENKLYQCYPDGKPCERSYGILVKMGSLWKFVPYACFFEDEILKLEFAFDCMLETLEKLAQNDDECAYVEYFQKLKRAFCEKDEVKIISAWQEAELAWMRVKSPLQVGHLLEYYEDSYTHAVAFEWDVRISEENSFNALNFCEEMQKSFLRVFENVGIEDESLKNEVCKNIQQTQLYICSPMLYYGAELKGLFSAQVVPNDEWVSARAGKKIFAFLNFVYENTKNKPFMKLSSEIFNKEFLDYGRKILFFDRELWSRVYEISTIGHEFGHIFFIAEDSEKAMNESGFFKNIEEYKATMGGLMNFFYHEEEELKLPIFHEFIKRAVGLIAWQRVDEVKAYYTEGLIELSLLFFSGVLEFSDGHLQVNFSLEFYEKFKELALQNYHDLAKHYALRLDAMEFLKTFCILKNGIFLPLHDKCREFVEFYYALYEKIGNEIDDSGEFEKYQMKVFNKNYEKIGF